MILIEMESNYKFLNFSHQGFGVLSVALASHALTLMSALLEDVSVEAIANCSTPPEPAPLHILSTATALQRAVTFLQAVPLNHLLFYLATISYRRVSLCNDCKLNVLYIIKVFIFILIYAIGLYFEENTKTSI